MLAILLAALMLYSACGISSFADRNPQSQTPLPKEDGDALQDGDLWFDAEGWFETIELYQVYEFLVREDADYYLEDEGNAIVIADGDALWYGFKDGVIPPGAEIEEDQLAPAFIFDFLCAHGETGPRWSLLPEGTEEGTCQICLDEMLVYYAAHCDIKTAAYGGINALLRKLRAAGIGAAVVTNKAQNAAQTLCDAKFEGLIPLVIGGAEGRRFKPAPDGVFAAMKTLGASPETTVYVGDSDVDMQTAANAGLPAVGVLWGFRDREDLEPYHPLALAATPEELGELLIGRRSR